MMLMGVLAGAQDLWLWAPGEPAASRGLGRTQGRGAVVDLAPDGRSYRVDERERRRALVDMLSGKLLAREVDGQFNPTGDRLVKVGDEIITAISLWDARTGARLPSLQPLSPVRLIRFSADGVRMLTVHSSGLRQVWDIQSGRLIQTIRALGDRGDPDEHGDGALSPDGRRALTDHQHPRPARVEGRLPGVLRHRVELRQQQPRIDIPHPRRRPLVDQVSRRLPARADGFRGEFALRYECRWRRRWRWPRCRCRWSGGSRRSGRCLTRWSWRYDSRGGLTGVVAVGGAEGGVPDNPARHGHPRRVTKVSR